MRRGEVRVWGGCVGGMRARGCRRVPWSLHARIRMCMARPCRHVFGTCVCCTARTHLVEHVAGVAHGACEGGRASITSSASRCAPNRNKNMGIHGHIYIHICFYTYIIHIYIHMYTCPYMGRLSVALRPTRQREGRQGGAACLGEGHGVTQPGQAWQARPPCAPAGTRSTGRPLPPAPLPPPALRRRARGAPEPPLASRAALLPKGRSLPPGATSHSSSLHSSCAARRSRDRSWYA
jgi:hypothetical protein